MDTTALRVAAVLPVGVRVLAAVLEPAAELLTVAEPAVEADTVPLPLAERELLELPVALGLPEEVLLWDTEELGERVSLLLAEAHWEPLPEALCL